MNIRSLIIFSLVSAVAIASAQGSGAKATSTTKVAQHHATMHHKKHHAAMKSKVAKSHKTAKKVAKAKK